MHSTLNQLKLASKSLFKTEPNITTSWSTRPIQPLKNMKKKKWIVIEILHQSLQKCPIDKPMSLPVICYAVFVCINEYFNARCISLKNVRCKWIKSNFIGVCSGTEMPMVHSTHTHTVYMYSMSTPLHTCVCMRALCKYPKTVNVNVFRFLFFLAHVLFRLLSGISHVSSQYIRSGIYMFCWRRLA